MNELEKKIKSIILELASEDYYGSWELWGAVNQDTVSMQPTRDDLKETFLSLIETLIQTKKLLVVSHKFKGPYNPVEYDRQRMEYEIDHAGKPDSDTFYWFWTTDEGKKEDIKLRS
ncbi:hypothetical protein KW782_00460 [Candidatus Parcubacteria bacterium]|nr:hypothetical protein [Candidatus Parcubacteria bacterium]